MRSPASTRPPRRPRSARSGPPGVPTTTLARRQLLALAAALPVGAGALAACSNASGTQLTSQVEHEQVPLSEVESLLPGAVTASNALGSAIIADYLTEEPAGNALVSPLSLSLVLALLAPGAADPGAQGFDELLGASGEDRDRTWSAIQTSVNRNDGDLDGFDPEEIPAEPLVHLANHVVIREGAEVSQDYLDTVLRWLDAQVEQVPGDRIKANLDEWAETNTGGLIPASGIKPTADTALVLQNALLFAARWASPFDTADTFPQDFTRADGSTVEAELMHATLALPYVTGEGWAAVRLDYEGGQSETGQGLALDVVLPDAGTSPTDLGSEAWSAACDALDEQARATERVEVELALPTLDLTGPATDLLALLTGQGLDPSDLGGIAPGLALSAVVQQVRLIIDEEGTVAAALSEAGMATSAPAPSTPVPFVVDHPYVLRLRDLDSGATLLEAVIMDPTAS